MSTMTPEAPVQGRSTLRLRTEALPWPHLFAAANATGLTHSSLWRAAKGEHAPSAVMIATLMKATGKPFDELFAVVPDPGRNVRSAA